MNILVVRTDKLGDFITALPAIYVLKHYNQQNKIIVCVAPINEELAKNCDFIDEVIVDKAQESIFTLVNKLTSAKIDASITLFSNVRVALAQFLARIPTRIAPATKIAQIFYTNRVKQKRSQVKMAEFEYNLALTQELFENISLEYKKPLLSFSNSKEVYESFCRKNKISRDVLAFHVGFGGSSDANFNTVEYESLIRSLLDQQKYQVLLTFGPDEEELCEEMKAKLEGERVLFYLSRDGLIHFAKLISHLKLFVSTSTGTYHLASLVGTPTMTFFGDSLFASSKRWKGVGEEKLQMHFMLPRDEEKRKEILEDVREKLLSF
jgi:ADP-heptose:LPS heptosyltransferase